jgi:hypothetical protein
LEISPETQPYNPRMRAFRVLPLFIALCTVTPAQQAVSFATEDGGRVCADLYGRGSKAVVLAHGGRFKKESWRNQALALAAAGFKIRLCARICKNA